MCTENNATEKNCATVAWTVNGHSIKDYQIVYGDNDKDIGENISAFQQQLFEKTGCLLNAGLDTDMPQSKYEIIIGKTNRSESDAVKKPSALNYVVKVVNDKLVFKYGGLHTREVIITKLVELLTDGQDMVEMNDSYVFSGNLYDDPFDSKLAEGTDVRIMDCNLMADRRAYDDGAWAEYGFIFDRRAEIFFGNIDYYNPTVIGFQEGCDSWFKSMEDYEHISKWDVLKIPNPLFNNEQYVFSSVMYRKDLYNLLDSGSKYYSAGGNPRCRWYTWVILEDKASKKRFGVVSTHWCGNCDPECTVGQGQELSEFVNRVTDTMNIPVFTMADFNCDEGLPTWCKYLTDIDSYDAMYPGEDVNKVNTEGSWHGWSKGISSYHSIDHITIPNKGCKLLRFETLMYNQQIYSSDHAWLLVDVKINN